MDSMKRVKCNFHVDNLQSNHRYDIILGLDILSKLKIDLCLSNYTIKVNWGAYECCMTPMKDVKKLNRKTSSNWINKKIFQDE